VVGLVPHRTRGKRDRVRVLGWADAWHERDVQLPVNVDCDVAEVDVYPIAGALDLREGGDEPREALQNSVETLLVCRQRLNGARESLNVFVQRRL